MNDLELYREELANCDAKITEALKERYAIIEKIMAYKESVFINIGKSRNRRQTGTGRKAEEETDVQPSQ